MASGSLTPGFLSESTSGRGIKVAASSTPGTLLHTAVSGAASIDWVSISFVNTHTGNVVLEVEFGGTTDPDDHIEITLGSKRQMVLVCDRMPINGGLEVRAFADVADVLVAFGEVWTGEL